MQSQYLKHVGAELDPNIDVLWTGQKGNVAVVDRERIEDIILYNYTLQCSVSVCVCVCVCVCGSD